MKYEDRKIQTQEDMKTWRHEDMKIPKCENVALWQLQALRERVMALLTTLAVADDTKLVDWLQQRLGLLEQRDTAMLHREQSKIRTRVVR